MGKGRNFAKAVHSKVTPSGRWAPEIKKGKVDNITRFTLTEYKNRLNLEKLVKEKFLARAKESAPD